MGESIEGKTEPDKLSPRNVKSGEESTLGAEGVFMFAGTRPFTAFINGAVDLNKYDFIQTAGLG